MLLLFTVSALVLSELEKRLCREVGEALEQVQAAVVMNSNAHNACKELASLLRRAMEANKESVCCDYLC